MHRLRLRFSAIVLQIAMHPERPCCPALYPSRRQLPARSYNLMLGSSQHSDRARPTSHCQHLSRNPGQDSSVAKWLHQSSMHLHHHSHTRRRQHADPGIPYLHLLNELGIPRRRYQFLDCGWEIDHHSCPGSDHLGPLTCRRCHERTYECSVHPGVW